MEVLAAVTWVAWVVIVWAVFIYAFYIREDVE